MKISDKEIKTKIISKMDHHTCNEKWGCHICYNNFPCVDYKILELAKKAMQFAGNW